MLLLFSPTTSDTWFSPSPTDSFMSHPSTLPSSFPLLFPPCLFPALPQYLPFSTSHSLPYSHPSLLSSSFNSLILGYLSSIYEQTSFPLRWAPPFHPSPFTPSHFPCFCSLAFSLSPQFLSLFLPFLLSSLHPFHLSLFTPSHFPYFSSLVVPFFPP